MQTIRWSDTMRAILCSSFTGPGDLRLSEIDEPKPSGDEILIAVHAASVSFMDQLVVSGLYQMRPPTPFVPGTEASGVVIAVGGEVTAFAPGDRVACSAWTGGYAERMIAKDSKCVLLPEGVAFEAAATVLHNYGTAYYALVERARAQRGETLFVTGAAGGVGLAAVDLGRHLGLRVIAGIGSDDKAALVRNMEPATSSIIVARICATGSRRSPAAKGSISASTMSAARYSSRWPGR
jgi:NADPH:quinone reductase